MSSRAVQGPVSSKPAGLSKGLCPAGLSKGLCPAGLSKLGPVSIRAEQTSRAVSSRAE